MTNKRPEISREQQSLLDNLLREISVATGGKEANDTTISDLRKLLKRNLSGKEANEWRKHRQKFIRGNINSKKADVAERKKTQQFLRQERERLGLLNLTNVQLCIRITELNVLHLLKVENSVGEIIPKKGKAATNQLVSALASYPDYLMRISNQVKLFTRNQIDEALLELHKILPEFSSREIKLKMAEAIKTVHEQAQVEIIRRRENKLITELSEKELLEELFSIFACAKRYKWSQGVYQLLRMRLENLKHPELFDQLKSKIKELPLSKRLTQQLKTQVLEAIDQYLNTPKRIKKDHLGRPITQ